MWPLLIPYIYTYIQCTYYGAYDSALCKFVSNWCHLLRSVMFIYVYYCYYYQYLFRVCLDPFIWRN